MVTIEETDRADLPWSVKLETHAGRVYCYLASGSYRRTWHQANATLERMNAEHTAMKKAVRAR